MNNLSRRNFLAVAGGLTGALALAGCNNASQGGEKTDEAAKDDTTAEDADTASDGDLGLVAEGTFTVAMSPDYPPFENMDGTEHVGFDVDLSAAIAEKLGLTVEYKDMNFDAICTAIAAGGQADVGCSGISIEPDREEQVDFSDPYYTDDQCVVTMTANEAITKDNYEDELNKEGVIIAVQSGTTSETFAKETFPNATIKPYTAATECFADLQANTEFTSDRPLAVVINLSVGAAMLKEAYTDAHVVGQVAAGEDYAVAVSKDNPALLKAVNGAIAELSDEGKLDELASTWGLA